MQFRDLPKQYEVLKEQIDAAMISVATSARFISGPEVKELEKKLAEYVGVKHCITCANGTDAISIAITADVITPNTNILFALYILLQIISIWSY